MQRFRDGYTRLPPMQQLGVCLRTQVGLQFSRDIGWLMAAEVIACGLDISFAPVLDVDRDTSSIIGDGDFSDQPQLVIDVAAEFIGGMNEVDGGHRQHFPATAASLPTVISRLRWTIATGSNSGSTICAPSLNSVPPAGLCWPILPIPI